MPPAPTTSAAALSNLQQFQGSMAAPQDILKQQETQLGVPQAQQQVSGLRQAITNTTNLLNNVAPSVMGRTQNSLVTSAQANRQIQNEQAPISQTLNKENADFGNASSDYKDLLGKASTLADLSQRGQESKLSNLENIYKALYQQEQDAASKQTEAAKQAEMIREFNASNAISQQRANTEASAAANKTPSQQEQWAMVASDIRAWNGGKGVGSDGYANPNAYNEAKAQWIDSGGSSSSFDSHFAGLRNPYQPPGQYNLGG